MDLNCKPECATDAEGQPRDPLTTTCGECKRSWCARCHPAPSARCHFEDDHVYEIDDSGSAEPVPLAPWLTEGQCRTVEHWQAYNVPAQWLVSQPDGEGAVTVVALGGDAGGGFVWSFVIDPDGECSSSESTVGPWETGVTI